LVPVPASKLTIVDLVCPLKLAVMVAEALLLMVPAVAVNVPVVEPLILTLPGAGNSVVLLLKFNVAVPVGTPANVTVHVVVCPVPSVDGLQLTPDSCADPEGATRFSRKLCD
jgi:hypothetical protein